MLNLRIFAVFLTFCVSACTASDTPPATDIERCLSSCDKSFVSCRSSMLSKAAQAISAHGQYCVSVSGSMKCFTRFDKSDIEPLLEQCRHGCQIEAEAEERRARDYAAYDECVKNELSSACQTAMADAADATARFEECEYPCRSGLKCEDWLAKDFEACDSRCEAFSIQAEAAAIEKSNACDSELKAGAKTCRTLSPEVTECSSGCPDIFLGNGICDRACAVPECDYDEGDCGDPTQMCAPGCWPAWRGDGTCQKECEVRECKFDNGDCPYWDDCPINSGYPCACHLSTSRCDDYTPCIKFGSGAYGLCMKPCQYPGELSNCEEAFWGWVPYGIPACIWEMGNGALCGIICRLNDKGTAGFDCPPGTHCVNETYPEGIAGVCKPIS
jgi:hypothetical protein